MNDTTLSPAERIRVFAAAVRSELADLPEDDLEDLVGGLVGDLTDQAADNGGAIDLGDPIVYARELRAAAGLPERTDAMAQPPLRQRLRAGVTGYASDIRSSRFGSWLLDLLVALRPVWWVLRGLGMYGAIAFLVFPEEIREQSPDRWLILLGLVLLSVQWGRGYWLPKNWVRHIRTVAGAVAIVALPALASVVLQPQYVDDGGYIPEGLLLDGVQVENLFVYDSEGNLLDGAQIYTGRGTPLNLYGANSAELEFGWQQEEGVVSLPGTDLRGDPIWNVYPLQVAPFDPTTGQPDRNDAESPTPPFVRAPQRATAPTPTPSPTPAPGSGEPTP
ncbi:hypothetical protein [Microbacterium sp.]|uniref:hypothetical protein n=1 Tax=Microbacterium sp. TaxID=51671 RepID=UPI002811EB7C|nr:hypothetical protein [Microbacterium sp.]